MKHKNQFTKVIQISDHHISGIFYILHLVVMIPNIYVISTQYDIMQHKEFWILKHENILVMKLSTLVNNRIIML